MLSSGSVGTTRSSPVHITVSALVWHGDRILLHRHKRRPLLLPPGGHPEPGEPLPAAAVREVREETGVRCEISDSRRPLLFYAGAAPPCKVHVDVTFEARASVEAIAPAYGESRDVRWVRLADVQECDEVPATFRSLCRDLNARADECGRR